MKEIIRLLPGEHIIYYADCANCPYGEKTREFVTDRAREISRFLIDKGADIIVVACNTATAASINILRQEFDIPFIGMEPAIKPAAEHTKTGTVGVLATAGTLKAKKYHDTREAYAEDVKVVEHVGEGFVELVENGEVSGEKAEEVVRRSVAPLIQAGADHIVLGCTHYPFLAETISKVAHSLAPGREISIIDPAPAVARQLKKILSAQGRYTEAISAQDGNLETMSAQGENEKEQDEMISTRSGNIEFYCSDPSINIEDTWKKVF